MGNHARLSPSNKSWSLCPGSVREQAAYPDTAGDAAIDGTGSHLLAEMCAETRDPNIKASKFYKKLIGEGHEDKPEGWVVDAERCKRVQVYLDYIKARDEQLGGCTLLTEVATNPGSFFGRTDWYGTCDKAMLQIEGTPGKILEVIDYKDGFQFVEVKNNTQMLSYLCGILAPFLFPELTDCREITPDFAACVVQNVRMTIVQPKTAKPVRYHDMTVQEAWELILPLASAAYKTDAPDAPLCAGKTQCEWCAHKTNCAEFAAHGMKGLTMIAKTDTNTLEQIETGQLSVKAMSEAQLSAFYDTKKALEKTYKMVEDEMFDRLSGGHDIPNYTLKAGRGKNVWMFDDETIDKKLRSILTKKDERYPPKLITPAAALKHPNMTDRRKKRVQEELIKYVAGDQKVTWVADAPKDASSMFAKQPFTSKFARRLT